MKHAPHRAGALTVALGIATCLLQSSASAQVSACTFPTVPYSTPEETAWRLFVAANCPANSGQVVWENWMEQSQVYPATGGVAVAARQPAKRLHESPLARALGARAQGLRAALLAPSTECNKMHGPPDNVLPNATVCEEVHINPDGVAFLNEKGYQQRPAQTEAAQKGTDIEFSKPAIEVKVDWIPATDFATPFTCSSPPAGVHVASIDGVCYAMAGMHISSKLLNNWLWATFEPQSMLTNPLRCITFGACNDSWGSNPATSNGGAGGFTQASAALQTLMTEAKLAPEFFNYRLDGVQIDFTANGAPTFLGNSIIEGENVGMKKDEASCITCHSVSSIKKDGTDGINVLINLPNPPVGAQYQIPPDWIARDFVWSMGLACPDPTGTGEQACH
jgi:hypothetical protein